MCVCVCTQLCVSRARGGVLELTAGFLLYRDPSLFCRVSTVFVSGVLAWWTPQLLEALHRQSSATPMVGGGAGKKPDKSKSKGGLSLLSHFPGAEEELKEALKVHSVTHAGSSWVSVTV